MKIIIGTKNQLFKTIGRTENFEPVLFFKIGEKKQAFKDLTNYYCEFHKVLETAIQFTEQEYLKFEKQFTERAEAKARETIGYVIENEIMFENRFFTFLKKQK